jgi:hypothetical protein
MNALNMLCNLLLKYQWDLYIFLLSPATLSLHSYYLFPCLLLRLRERRLSQDMPLAKRLSNLARKLANQQPFQEIWTRVHVNPDFKGSVTVQTNSHRICPRVLTFTAFLKSVSRLLDKSNLKGERHLCPRFRRI